MPEPHDPTRLPEGLPVPVDDGACDHLPGMRLPPVGLRSTAGRTVRLDDEGAGRTVVYCYPRTGRPGVPLPAGWDEIPGARGCTPESCAFRDHERDFRRLGARVFGLSAQSTAEQQEAAARLGLPHELLSDAGLEFATALRLPTFEAGGMTLIRRLTLVVDGGRVTHVFYPVFPPDAHAGEVLRWLADHPAAGRAAV
jgi:peroxiredoxin